MNKVLKYLIISLAAIIIAGGITIPVIASMEKEDTGVVVENTTVTEEPETAITSSDQTNTKALASALVVGAAAAAGALGMAIAISKSVESVARQPEASGKIQTMLMLGLVFIETAIIYALIVAILLIFVL